MKKILIIRFSSIGDIVLTTPVIRCVKKQVAGAELHFLTKPSFAGILKNNPFVDKVIVLNDDLNVTLDELKKENYDFVVDLHHNARSFRVKLSLGKPSASFNKLNVEKWLLVNLKIDRMPTAHIVERYMETVDSLNVHYDGAGLDFFIPAEDEITIQNFAAPWKDGYVAMVIGAKHFTKKMPDTKLVELINQMKLPVILI
ncbi:MAG TPA: glycosyltransferase family 9 protein, partial [Bacteroidia bacterium]|nr:glycosyltransferase family 9 protein [Bacteroidia bacterium]